MNSATITMIFPFYWKHFTTGTEGDDTSNEKWYKVRSATLSTRGTRKWEILAHNKVKVETVATEKRNGYAGYRNSIINGKYEVRRNRKNEQMKEGN